MELRFVTPELRRLDELASEVLACGVFLDERPHHGTAGLVDWRLSGLVSRLIRREFITGKRGEAVMLPLRPKMPFDKALLFGMGSRRDFDDAAFRGVTEHLLTALEGLCARSAVVELPGRHRGAIEPERATDILFELAGGRPEHDIWTLIEPSEDQKRIAARVSEQRRRDRRIVLGP
jgi:cytosol aminopeptidase family protein